MPKSKNIMIKYTNREFSTIKEDLIEYAKRYYPDSYKDFSKASFGSMVLDSVAYIGDVLSYYIDYSVNESFLDTAIEYDNVRKHARSLGYNFMGAPSSFGHLKFYVLIPADSEGMAPDTSYLPVLKTGTVLGSDNGINFTLLEDVRFDEPSNQYVSARFDDSTGKTTHFAVMSQGVVQSGEIFNIEASVRNTAFERFKRVFISDQPVSEVVSVEDSDGNKYYQVDNLAQEVIFKETTNSNAASDGVSSILKPFVVSRRFVVEQDDTGTYLQFGFGSDNDDVAGLTDPSKVALNRHGKKYISNFSFDPTKMLSTNKLGISPQDTILSISYRSSNTTDSSVPSNSITSVLSSDLQFQDVLNLDETLVSEVTDSLECTNLEPLNCTDQDMTLEELKIRAKSYYSTQSRAVTRTDYESLIYSMPPKFGSIKRVSLMEDPSSTTRKLSIYVVTEDSNGHLIPTHTVIKNNIKNWLSNYKMINDHLEIKDTVILNYSVDFTVLADKFFNTEDVLLDCIAALRDHFSVTSYIGEPLYITRIYEVLNSVEGVIDVKKVEIENKSGDLYSQFSLDFDDIISQDGTFYKVPKNVILELKYLDDDIKGTVI